MHYYSLSLSNKKGISFVALKSRKLVDYCSLLIIAGFYLAIVVPNFFTSIYAEDGARYLQDALDTGGVNNIFKTLAGFADVPARIIAAIASLSPPEWYPISLGVLTILIVALCVIVVFDSVLPILKNKFLAYLFAIFLLVLPIARFESIGNVTNLHFYFFTSSAFILLHFLFRGKISIFQGIFILLAALSVPLTLFLFVFLFYKVNPKLYFRLEFKSLIINPFIILGVGSLINFLISWGDTSSRAPRSLNSIFKVAYLYLDRIVGSTFIPLWGRVYSDKDGIGISNSIFNLIGVRLIAASLIFILLLLFSLKLNKDSRNFALFLLGISVLFGVLLGFFFNLEPRYCIFPSYLLAFVLFFIISSQKKRWLEPIVLILLLLLTVNASSDIASRQNSNDWRGQVAIARGKCQNNGILENVRIRIAPFRADAYWSIRLPCSTLN